MQLTLSERDEIVISLNQHSISEPRVIGFTVYESRIPLCNGNDLNVSGKENNSTSTVQGKYAKMIPKLRFKRNLDLK